MSKFDQYPIPTVDEIDLAPEFRELYIELYNDIKTELPKKPYKGNCTKEFCSKIVDLYLDKEFDRIQQFDFPSTRENPITQEMADKEIIKLFTTSEDLSKKNAWNCIRYYHPSFKKANRKGAKSPLDGWNYIKSNKEVFKKFYENRLRCSDWFKEKKWHNLKYLVQGYVPEFIYGIGLSTSRLYPEVSYFKPGLAKYIVQKYLNDYSEVFDPFTGYSARMLGTLACGKKYFGQDLCLYTVEECNALYEHLKEIKELYNKVPESNIIIADTEKTGGEYECLFTCPPYDDLEQWPNDCEAYHSCDDWIDICLNNYKCKRYVFVIDDTVEKYKKNIVETLTNTSHFGKNNEYIVVIDK